MTAAISTLRATIAAALVDNALWSVFSFPPATPIVNSVVISPADPYVTPSLITSTTLLRRLLTFL
jgi:hypothetical protein